MDATPEEWRPIPGWEGYYEASTRGRIRSMKRATPYLMTPQWNPAKGKFHIILSIGGKQHTKYLHTLVATTFHGPRPDGMWALHNDDDSHNNRPENLRWDTPSSNVHDMVNAGNHHYGKRTHCKRLHEYTPENTLWRRASGVRYVNPGMYRLCRKCMRINNGLRS